MTSALLYTVAYLGQFLENEKYLVVADYGQRRIYQLNPDSGEVGATITQPCYPDTMSFVGLKKIWGVGTPHLGRHPPLNFFGVVN